MEGQVHADVEQLPETGSIHIYLVSWAEDGEREGLLQPEPEPAYKSERQGVKMKRKREDGEDVEEPKGDEFELRGDLRWC